MSVPGAPMNCPFIPCICCRCFAPCSSHPLTSTYENCKMFTFCIKNESVKNDLCLISEYYYQLLVITPNKLLMETVLYPSMSHLKKIQSSND